MHFTQRSNFLFSLNFLKWRSVIIFEMQLCDQYMLCQFSEYVMEESFLCIFSIRYKFTIHRPIRINRINVIMFIFVRIVIFYSKRSVFSWFYLCSFEEHLISTHFTLYITLFITKLMASFYLNNGMFLFLVAGNWQTTKFIPSKRTPFKILYHWNDCKYCQNLQIYIFMVWIVFKMSESDKNLKLSCFYYDECLK